MSSLKLKSDSELKKIVDESYGKYNPDMPKIMKELFSRDIYYKSPQEIKDKIEFNKMTNEMWEKRHPQSTMSFYWISQETFIDEISKIIPQQWTLEITPEDYIESPEKYDNIKIVLTHKEFSKIVLHSNPTYPHTRESPWHYHRLYSDIATTIYDQVEEPEKYEKLLEHISLHFSQFFSARRCKKQE